MEKSVFVTGGFTPVFKGLRDFEQFSIMDFMHLDESSFCPGSKKAAPEPAVQKPGFYCEIAQKLTDYFVKSNRLAQNFIIFFNHFGEISIFKNRSTCYCIFIRGIPSAKRTYDSYSREGLSKPSS